MYTLPMEESDTEADDYEKETEEAADRWRQLVGNRTEVMRPSRLLEEAASWKKELGVLPDWLRHEVQSKMEDISESERCLQARELSRLAQEDKHSANVAAVQKVFTEMAGVLRADRRRREQGKGVGYKALPAGERDGPIPAMGKDTEGPSKKKTKLGTRARKRAAELRAYAESGGDQALVAAAARAMEAARLSPAGCLARAPCLGDLVIATEDVALADADEEREWTLPAGTYAMVVATNGDGDFRLLNPEGVTSARAFRRYFLFAQGPRQKEWALETTRPEVCTATL